MIDLHTNLHTMSQESVAQSAERKAKALDDTIDKAFDDALEDAVEKAVKRHGPLGPNDRVGVGFDINPDYFTDEERHLYEKNVRKIRSQWDRATRDCAELAASTAKSSSSSNQ